jgi:CheY-like chemotaxis protein
MNLSLPSVTILMADDDPDDRFLVKEALAETAAATDFRSVEDGERLLAYLRREGAYAGHEEAPRPSLILLDLNMPRKDGREALREIKSDPSLRQIPVVVMSTSQAEGDVVGSYDLGANSFVTKPGSFDELLDLMSRLSAYWADTVRLPAYN